MVRQQILQSGLPTVAGCADETSRPSPAADNGDELGLRLRLRTAETAQRRRPPTEKKLQSTVT